MKVYSAKSNKLIDSYAINVLGIPGVELMANAAREIADTVRLNVQPLSSVCIVCGNGNNAGDGFALAPLLTDMGYKVSIVCSNDKEFSKDAEYYFERLDGVPVLRFTDDKYEALEKIYEADAVVDAIYGNGFRGSLDEDCSEIALAINRSNAFVIAVDIPSGCVCNTGRVDKIAVKANITVALSTLKPCYYLYPACDYCGNVIIKDIGIPQEAYENANFCACIITKELCSSILKQRPQNSHKGTFGKLLLACGSKEMPGAASLALFGALKSGVGLTLLASEQSVCDKASYKFAEPIYAPFDSIGDLADNVREVAFGCQAAVVGCGLGRGEEAGEVVNELLQVEGLPLLIDADGINALKTNINILKGRSGGCVITPHPKEMSSLSGLTLTEILNDRIGVAKNMALELNSVVVLKGAHTIIAVPDNSVYINLVSNSGLAKGGSGDVLAGVIGSLLAQGYSTKDAAVLGVYLHSKAADYCAAKSGEETMLPSELPLYFNEVFSELKGAE